MDINEPHPDPIAEGLIHSGQRLVQVVTAGAAFCQLASRLRTEQEPDESPLTGSELQKLLAKARSQWKPALDTQWRESASMPDLAKAWCAAIAFQSDSDEASKAVAACEQQLSALQPDGMRVYTAWREVGLEPLEAMAKAASFIAKRPRPPHEVAADGFPHDIREAMRISASHGFFSRARRPQLPRRVPRRTR